MKTILVVMAAIVLAIGFSAAGKKYKQHIAEQQAIADAGAAVEKAEAAVRAGLKDPESAKFRGSTYNKDTGAVCGDVNAKNSYGGYVGFSPFFVVKDGKAVIAPPDPNTAVGVDLDRYKALVKFLDLHKQVCAAKKSG